MNIIPAIDIKNQKCVRLYKGKADSETIYYENPLDAAKKFEEYGFTNIHIVDLDAAFTGDFINLNVIKEIKESTNFKIEYGGGIRDYEKAKEIIDLGIDKIIIGTMAIKNREIFNRIVKDYKENIIVGLDVMNESVLIKGWEENSQMNIFEKLSEFTDMGLKNFIVTDVSKDGTLKGSNVLLYKKIMGKFDINLIASGGVGSKEDILKLKEIGIENVIVGKAIYENKLNLLEWVKW